MILWKRALKYQSLEIYHVLSTARVPVAFIKSDTPLCRIAVYWEVVDDTPEITVLQLRKFKVEAAELIGANGIEAVAVYLIDHPDAGDVIPGSGGVRKLRWAAKEKESVAAPELSTFTLWLPLVFT